MDLLCALSHTSRKVSVASLAPSVQFTSVYFMLLSLCSNP